MTAKEGHKMLNIPGLVAIIIFYIMILGVGFWAAWKRKKAIANDNNTNEIMLAGRSIGTFVGCLTMTGN